MPKKPVTPEEFQKIDETRLNNQPKLIRDSEAATIAKARAGHYANGANLLQQVTTTLQNIAVNHPDPNARKQAELAVNKLADAQAAFGDAALCLGVIWNKDDI